MLTGGILQESREVRPLPFLSLHPPLPLSWSLEFKSQERPGSHESQPGPCTGGGNFSGRLGSSSCTSRWKGKEQVLYPNLLSIGVTVTKAMTKSTLGSNGFIPFYNYSPSWREIKAGTRRQKPPKVGVPFHINRENWLIQASLMRVSSQLRFPLPRWL